MRWRMGADGRHGHHERIGCVAGLLGPFARRGVKGSWHARAGRAFVLGLVLPALIALTLTSGSGSKQGLRITVSPTTSLFDTPLMIRISGLRAGQRVTLTVRSIDFRHVSWESTSVYIAGPNGTVDPTTDPSIGPSYTDVDPMGPIDFMAPSPKENALYTWGNGQRALAFHFQVRARDQKASATVERDVGPGITITSESLTREGFVGDYYSPTASSPLRRSAILVFGGSGGGMEPGVLALALAAHGYPVLNLAYFNEPGLPSTLSAIPLEYFAKALRWLAAQPDVNPDGIWVDGASRGSEAALLLGVNYPNLVHGVIALVPSDVAICSFPGCSGPAWTLNGHALAYTRQFDNPHPSDNPAAVIPVDKIKGPVLLDCGYVDLVWSSCVYAQAIMAELATAKDPYPHQLLVSDDGGHGSAVGLPPYQPGAAQQEWETTVAGSTPIANDLAWAAQWPKLLRFLDHQ